MIMRGSLLLLLSMLGKTSSQEFVNGKPDFFPNGLPAPLAYYYFDDGSGYDLKDSVSGNSAAGSVIFEEADQTSPAQHEPNWVNDEFFGMTIGCGELEDSGDFQKDTLSLEDVDYGSGGSWAWSVWFRHEDVNFPDYQREQFFGHGDPTQSTSANNQMHVQFESSGAVRTIVSDINDSGSFSQDTPELDLDDGNWHQYVLSTREDGNQGYNVYIDGTLRASSPDGGAGGDEMNPTGNIRLCGREQSAGFNDQRYFLGQVAHFSVWDSALSQDDVANLYLAYTSQYMNGGTPGDDEVEGTPEDDEVEGTPEDDEVEGTPEDDEDEEDIGCSLCGEAWSEEVYFTNPNDEAEIPNFGVYPCGTVETAAKTPGFLPPGLCADAQVLTNVCICSNGGPVPDNPPCYLCGNEDEVFTNPDGMTNAPGFETTCRNLEELALGGSLTPNVCAQSKDIIADDCFCPGTPVAASAAPSTTPVRDDSGCGTEEAYKEAGTCGTGGCYDVDGSFSGIAHSCACQENSCNESLCAEVGGIWTPDCTSAWCNNGWCDVVNGLVDAPVDDAPVDDAPVDDAPVDDAPVDDDTPDDDPVGTTTAPNPSPTPAPTTSSAVDEFTTAKIGFFVSLLVAGFTLL